MDNAREALANEIRETLGEYDNPEKPMVQLIKNIVAENKRFQEKTVKCPDCKGVIETKEDAPLMCSKCKHQFYLCPS